MKKKKKSHKMDTYWLKYCQLKSKLEGILVSIQCTQIHSLLVDQMVIDNSVNYLVCLLISMRNSNI